MSVLKVYEAHYDHQMEGGKIGTYSSLEKALESLRRIPNNKDLEIEKHWESYGKYVLSNPDYFILEIKVY